MSVYQHWDPLKKIIVGKSYPPEFYSWIKNTNARNAMERIAIETEEDYQSLIKILKSFDVDVIRPYVSANHKVYFNNITNTFITPPMVPRDDSGMYGNRFFYGFRNSLNLLSSYKNSKDDSWPDISSVDDFNALPKYILNELSLIHNIHYHKELFPYEDVINSAKMINPNSSVVPMPIINDNGRHLDLSTSQNTRIGKDLYIGNKCRTLTTADKEYIDKSFDDYRITYIDVNGHADGTYCPVVPGLILSIKDIKNYSSTFPDWEVLHLPYQSWSKVSSFLQLKQKNQGKWWIPGEEGNNALIELVENWLNNWVGYVEETVFDVNILVINEQNIIVNNYNKEVFDVLEKYGVTPHICNFRHRYFWDGGIHCITSDLDREGNMKNYFPERDEF